jgi:CBS domain-containing protein
MPVACCASLRRNAHHDAVARGLLRHHRRVRAREPVPGVREHSVVVEEVMGTEPLAVEANESVRAAREKLMESYERRLPVMEHGRLVGMISDRDMPPMLVERAPGAGSKDLEARPISNLMSVDILSVYPQSRLSEAVDLMLEHGVGAIPVVDPDSLGLIGVISYVDVLRAARPFL